MSKKFGPMDDYFQKYNLPRILISRNLDMYSDLIDELFDKRLHLPENLTLILENWKHYVR